jgi:hypothetical protein
LNEIVNKVAASGLISLDIQDLLPKEERVVLDIAPVLWQGLVLKEKDFRAFIAEHNWSAYQNKNLSFYCSVDAIIPTWAWMLLTTAAQPFAKRICFGNEAQHINQLLSEAIRNMNVNAYEGARVVVKGCSELPVNESIYVLLTERLLPHVKSLMFGEPCSTVPLFKKK